MKKFLLLSIFVLLFSRLYADDYYWVGGAGSWSDLNHWASTSGGVANKSIIPGTGDDVHFDANSGLANGTLVTLPVTGHAYCRNMSWAGVTTAPQFRYGSTSFQLQVNGNLELSATVLYGIMTINFTGSSNATFRTNGAVRMNNAGIYNSFIVNKPGGSLTLVDGISGNLAVQNITLVAGLLNLSGQTHTFGNFVGTGTASRSLNISNATINVTSTWDTRGSNMTLTAAGSTITADMFHSTGLTFAKVFPGRNNPDMEINSNTFEELTFTAQAANIGTLRLGTNNTVGRLEFKGGGRLMAGNVIGTLILAPGKGYIFHGNNTINTLMQANSPDCDALGELRGIDANAIINFGTSATADIRNVLITSLTAAGGITPITVVGVDGGSNTGWNIQPRASGNATLYWVGGGGDWNDKAHWSATSGGPGGACVPFMTDNVVFDANSGFTAASKTVALSSSTWCHNMTWTNVPNSPILETGGHPLEIWGSISLDPTLTLQTMQTQYVRDVITLKGTEASTLAFNGYKLGNPLFNVEKTGTNGGLTIMDDVACPTCSLRVASGKFLMPGRTLNIAEFRSQTTLARTIDFSNTTITVNDWAVDSRGATSVNNGAGSFITAKVYLVTNGFTYPKIYSDASVNSVNITGTTIGELVFTNTSPTTDVTALSGNGGNTIGTLDVRCGGVDFRGTNTINNLLLAPSRTYYFKGTQTITGLFRFNSPDCSGLGELRDLDGTPAILNFGPSSTRDFNNVYLLNMTATGSGVPISVSGADAGGNAGFNITPSAAGPRYWVGGSGDWNESVHWSTASGGPGGACVPTVSNDVFFDANSFTAGGSNVAVTGNAYCRNMDWTGAVNAPTFTNDAAFVLEIWGNLVLNPAVNMNAKVTFTGPANATLTPNNASLGPIFLDINKPAGSSLTFLGDYNNPSASITLTSGGLNVSGRTVVAAVFSDQTTASPTSLDIRNANISCRWQYTGSNKSLQAAGSHITAGLFRANGGVYNSVDVGTAISTNIGILQTTFNDLTFSNTSNTSQALIAANNTIGRLEFKGKGNIAATGNTIDTLIFSPGKVYTFASGSNTTITKEWFGSGTPCNLTEITSSSTGAFTVTKTAGQVSFDYVRLRNVTAAGITPFKALEHTENLGNNTNWDIAPYNGSTPILGLGPDITLCADKFPHTLNTDGFFASPLASFKWSDGSTGKTLVANNPGTYSVTVSYPDGCTRTDAITITRSDVIIAPITGTANVCESNTTTLATTTPGGTWSTSDAAIATVSTAGLVTGIKAGTATITYTLTNGDGCTGTQTRTVTVNALPVVPAITGNTGLFAGGTTSLSNATPGGVWSSSNTAVATVNSSGLVTGISGGTADISYTVTSASGCVTSRKVTVTVDGFSPGLRVLAVTKTTDAQEPAANGAFSIHLPAGALAVEDITVTYTVSGTASAPADYTALSGTAVIPAGRNGAALPLIVRNDLLIEDDETVIVTLSAGTSASYTYTVDGAAGAATLQITDDDNVPANRVLSVTSQLNASEPAATGTFTVSLPTGILAPEDINVTYILAGSSTNGVDYETLPGTVIIPAGQNRAMINVKAIDDQIMEKTETIELTLTAGATATAGSFTISATQGRAVLNQNDDDYTTANRLLAVKANGDAGEPGTNSSFTISLPAGYTSYLPITVSCTLTGTATNGLDYNGPALTVTLPAGQNSVSVPVTVADDDLIEPTESVILTITGGVANEGGSAVFTFSPDPAANDATVNITDDDNTSANTTLSVSAENGAEPSTPGAFTISLPPGRLASETITVNYTVSGTAVAGLDYTALPVTAVIPAGRNSVRLPLNMIDDQVIESTETVTLTLTGGTSANFTYTPSTVNGSASADIADNDFTANSQVVLLTKVSDAIEGGTNGQYRISFPPGVTSAEDVTVMFTPGGSATNAADYTLLGLNGGNIVIPAGANEVYIDVDAVNDGLIEGPEGVQLTLNKASSASHPYTIDPSGNGATVNIVDANAASSTPLQVITGTNGAEGGANATFTVKLAGVATSAWPVTVGYRISGAATPGTDFESIGVVTIPANTNSIQVTLNVIDDKVIETTENVQFTLLSGSAADGGGNAFIFPPDPANNDITINIADNDAISANQVLKVASVTGGAEPAINGSYTVSLPDGYSSAANITLNYTMSGSATRNSDYSVVTITLPAYSNAVTIPLRVQDDPIIEGQESATLTLDAGAAGTDDNSFTYTRDAAAYEAAVNIADDDDIAANRVLTITTTQNATEGGTDGAVKISLPTGITASYPVTVNYTVTGAATNGLDYNTLTGTLTIPAGSNDVTLPVTVIDDQVIEPTETISLTITGGVGNGANYTPAADGETAVVNIADNDNIPANTALSITPGADVTEGTASPIEFTISLPGTITAAEDIIVLYNADGAAQPGLDYTAFPGSVVIPAGEHSITVSTPALDDQLLELAEPVRLTLAGGSSASFTFTGTGNAALNILDDENKPENLVLDITKAADAAEPVTNGSFRISLSTGIIAAEDITVNYTVSGTAASGADYDALAGTAVIPAGQTGVDVPVTVKDDQVIEATETVIATLTGGSSASFPFTGSASATVNIDDDESNIPGNRTLSITANAQGAEPATPGSFTISLPTGIQTAEDVTVNYTIGGTATAGSDYATLSGSAVIPAGQNNVRLPVTINDDQLIELTETVVATLTGGSSASFSFTGNDAATVNITDDESAPANLVLNITKGTDGAEPNTNGSFTISLPTGILTAEDLTVNYTMSGTATTGDDYTALSGAALIPAGQNSVTIPVTVADDDMIETTETVIATLTGGSSASFSFTGTGNAAVNITDNDDIPANRVLSITRLNDAAEPAAAGYFKMALPTGILAAEDITVTYTIAGSATANTDYAALTGTAIIPTGQNSVTVPVFVIDDQVIEPLETVGLTLTGGNSASFAFTGAGNITMSISDDDNAPANLVLNVVTTTTAAEPDVKGSFTISLPAGITATEDISVTYVTSGTATAGNDYGAPAGLVIIPAGDNSVEVPVDVLDDQLIEGTETVTIEVTGGASSSLTFMPGTDKTASMGIADDDLDPSKLVLSISKDADGAEPGTNGSFTISLPAGVTAAENITVNYTAAGTATAGADYAALAGTVVIPAGQTSVNIPLSITDDDLIEAAETVVLTITGGQSASVTYTVGANSSATVNIADDDNTNLDLMITASKPDASEPNTNGAFTISLAGGKRTAEPVAIRYVIGGTATAGADYAAITGTITIPAGESAQTVPVQVMDDAEVEAPETVIFTLSGGQSAAYTYTVGAPGQATVTISSEDVHNTDLLITKEIVQPAIGPYRIGQDITYRITVTNIGGGIANGVVVTDTLPVQFGTPGRIVQDEGQVEISAAGRLLRWAIGNVSPGATMQLEVSCRIIEGGPVTAPAIVASGTVDVDGTNNKAIMNVLVEGTDLLFPNTITPNGDGKNERFIIGGLEKYPGSALYVFNRWGGQVYQSRDYHNDWNGSDLNEGTYFYVLEVKKPDGIKKYKGWIIIVR